MAFVSLKLSKLNFSSFLHHSFRLQAKNYFRLHDKISTTYIPGLGPLGKVKVSKPIARVAAVIGLLEFLLGIGLLVGGVLLQVNDVNDELEVSYDPKFYGLWSAPGVILSTVVLLF